MRARWQASWEAHDLRWSVALVVAVALAASASGLVNLFAYDDIPIIVDNEMVTRLHGLGDYLTSSYWGPTRGNALYRPFTILAFALEWAVGGGSPFPFHLANVLLYAATGVAVLVLFRCLLPRGAALVAALGFAAHPVHVEAVANVVGQSEMLTAIPMLLAVIAYVRDRLQGPVRRQTVVVIAACLAWALLHKEHGIVLPALLLMTELTFRDRGFVALGADTRTQWMLARTLVLCVAAYVLMRLSVLSGFAGDAPHASLEGVTTGQRLLVMLGLVPQFVRLYLWPARLHPDYSPQAIPFLDTPSLGHLPGVVILLALLAALVWAWRRDRVIAFGLLWMGLTMGPTANILIPTGVLVAERTLFLPSVGVLLAFGRLVELMWRRLESTPTPWIRTAVPTAGLVLLTTATVHSAVRQRVWEDNVTLFSTMAVEAPNNFRAQFVLGELFGGAASWKRAEVHLRRADSLFSGYDLVQLSLARALHFDNRCPDAVPLYDSVLAGRPDAEIAHIGRTACLLEMRRLTEARDASVIGLARGETTGPFQVMLQKAESSLVATDTVDARNRWYRAGKPVSRSDARLVVPVLMMTPAPSGGRRKVPE